MRKEGAQGSSCYEAQKMREWAALPRKRKALWIWHVRNEWRKKLPISMCGNKSHAHACRAKRNQYHAHIYFLHVNKLYMRKRSREGIWNKVGSDY